MKIFILSDMEGVNGAVFGGYSPKKPRKSNDEDKDSRRRMTGEVNAACQGCMAMGARNIMLYEAHIFYREALPKWIHMTRDGFPQNPKYDAMIFVGQHAKAGVKNAVLSHTGSGRSISHFWVNGREFGEFGICAAYMGYYNIPTIFIAGDRAAVNEAKALIPNIESVSVEEGLGNHSAVCLSHRRATQLIQEGVSRAIRRRDACQPLRIKGPVTMAMEFRYSAIADEHARIPGVRRLNDKTTLWQAKNYILALEKYKNLAMSLAFWDRD